MSRSVHAKDSMSDGEAADCTIRSHHMQLLKEESSSAFLHNVSLKKCFIARSTVIFLR